MLKNLKELRVESNTTQKTLADSIGITQQSVNKYENHNIEPDISTLIKIADYFNTSVDYLIGHTDIKNMIESVQPNDLNEDEQAMINRYRSLTKEQKKLIQLLMESYHKE